MRNLSFATAILLSINCMFGSLLAEVLYPEITFTYNWQSHVLDTVCGLYYGTDVTDELQEKLDKQLPDFITAWEKDAPVLFGEVFSRFKRGFEDKERTAVICLSNGWSYGSGWFLFLGLRHYLDPEPWMVNASREDTFSSLVFHELLHVWVDENINKDNSPLLAKYSDEDATVLDHLHLMALQKMAYLNISRPDMVKMLDESYRNFGPAEYKRSWEIVNDIEGHETVLKDVEICLV